VVGTQGASKPVSEKTLHRTVGFSCAARRENLVQDNSWVRGEHGVVEGDAGESMLFWRNVVGHRVFTRADGRLSLGWRLINEASEVCAWCAGARRERVCAMRFQETILGRLSKTLHAQLGDIPREPLPRRWVDLIHHLDEQERKQSDRQPDQSSQRR
jgi:hypothetical protein